MASNSIIVLRDGVRALGVDIAGNGGLLKVSTSAVFSGRHVAERDMVFLNQKTNKAAANCDVLGSLMMNGLCGDC